MTPGAMATVMVIYGVSVMLLVCNKDVVTEDRSKMLGSWFDSVGNCSIWCVDRNPFVRNNRFVSLAHSHARSLC